jgi:RNA polymerase sigma-70 factor, ECF subfamily
VGVVPTDEPQRDPDALLLERIAAGDQRAFSALVDRHGRGIRIFAGRFLGNAEDGADVAQEVFLTVWRKASGFDPARGKASTWLYRIAANRCTDLSRRRAVLAFFGLDDDAGQIAADEPDAEAILSGRQALALARRGIAGLPARQRMALLLSVAAGMDAPDIAKAMDTSRGSVEQLLVRARRTLRETVDRA